jgi:dipeptidase E
MNLLFCSKLGRKNDKVVFDLLKDKNDIKIGYIPSKTDSDNKYYERVKDYYLRNYKLKNVVCLDIDKNYNKEYFSKNLKDCDVLILSGGDTVYFLNNLKKKKLLKEVGEFAKRKGKFLIGISAGAIIMTQDIGVGRILDSKPLKREKALGLVDFEFWPHFGESNAKLFEKYCRNLNKTVLTCKEYQSLFIDSFDNVDDDINLEKRRE